MWPSATRGYEFIMIVHEAMHDIHTGAKLHHDLCKDKSAVLVCRTSVKGTASDADMG